MSETDRYGLLFELSQDAVVEIEMVDNAPIVRAVNPAFTDIFGYDPETIVGESLNEFIVPEQHAGEAKSFDRRTAGGGENWATVSRMTAGGVREFLYRGVPFERDGHSYGLAVYTDITEQHRREQHHQVLHRVLRHNLRNNLAQILAVTEEILADAQADSMIENATRIRAAVDDLSSLSDAASRVEDVLGTKTVESRPVDLTAVLRSLVEQYQQSASSTEIESAISQSVDVIADRRLSIALDAVIENAVEHGRPDGDARPTVRITIGTEGPEAVVRITDNGTGIPEYERAAIFDDEPPSQLSHGSGLGLWLAKWIVEGYGGRLAYERRGGETTVLVRVPTVTAGTNHA